MIVDQVTLIEPDAAWERAYVRMVRAFRTAGERYRDYEKTVGMPDFAEYVAHLRAMAQGRELAPGLVPMSTYWLVSQDGRLLGDSRLRHQLTPALQHEGGHIGYRICPTARRQGYGTAILRLTLAKAAEHGIRRVLVTCNTANRGSARIIEKNGGRYENEVISYDSGLPVSRYWIDNSGPLAP